MPELRLSLSRVSTLNFKAMKQLQCKKFMGMATG
jgi:hypothetical protein